MDLTISNYNRYSTYANQTVYWSSTDNRDTWLANMRDPLTQQHLKKYNFDKEDSITYSYNSNGFRCDEFDHLPGFITLGCSLTLGIGVPAHTAWPEIIAKHTGLKARNLGIAGASMDTCVRMLLNYLDQLKPQFVALLSPPPDRFEFFINNVDNTINSFVPSMIVHPIQKYWYINEQNSHINFVKNFLLIKQLCQLQNIKLLHQDSISGILNYVQYDSYMTGRDLMHPGVSDHAACAEAFLKLIN